MAEGVFNKLVKERGLENQFTCTSAGTAGYHIGHLPDARARLVCELNRTPLEHLGRKFVFEDFGEFDYILAMDESNLRDILSLPNLTKADKEKITLLRSYEPDGEGKEVPDPYYGNLDDFKNVYEMVTKACNCFLNTIVK